MIEALAFVDPMAPKDYSGAPGHLAGLGGTEASLVKVAEALADSAPVVFERSWRRRPEIVSGVQYRSFDAKAPLPGPIATIVVINSWKVALRLRRLHPDATILLWLHVFPGRHNRGMGPALRNADIPIICVSQSHARWLATFLGTDAPRIRHIYNPIAEDLVPDTTQRDPDLLLFASSPHKGLNEVFQHFTVVRHRWPDLRLAVADPGYLSWPTGAVPDGVTFLGRLSPEVLAQWMRRSLCLFYPQTQFAETFGLVIAEANAVGCPALLHAGLGANDEIAGHHGQCIDTTAPAAVERKLAEWRAVSATAPMSVTLSDGLRLSAVVAAWRAELGPQANTAEQFFDAARLQQGAMEPDGRFVDGFLISATKEKIHGTQTRHEN
ncbi:glycosyltransferase family 4 protein [Frigidibacter sp. MR17.14]|uniref:glycosyltransferase family 4 protein n=1 Tax=Frigidibacter sp. MR17.14 TaxID=3126509 RepID=UPI003012C998